MRALNAIARRRGQSLAQMALAWALRDKRVTSALIGASRPEQVDRHASRALEKLDFSPEELTAIDGHAVEAGINLWARSAELACKRNEAAGARSGKLFNGGFLAFQVDLGAAASGLRAVPSTVQESCRSGRRVPGKARDLASCPSPEKAKVRLDRTSHSVRLQPLAGDLLSFRARPGPSGRRRVRAARAARPA